MGWTSKDVRKGEIIDRDAIVRAEMRPLEVIDFAYKGNTAFVAAKDADGVVSALVVIFERDATNLAWKVIHEAEGPFYDGCPAKLMKLLSPTDNENALTWRRRQPGRNPKWLDATVSA